MLIPVVMLSTQLSSKDGAPTVVTPGWGMSPKVQGWECVDASADHAPFQENNTRFSFYAVPNGVPPTDAGWPVFIDFVAQPYTPGNTTFNPKAACGNGWVDPTAANGWGPSPPPSCLEYLGSSCPRPKFQAMGSAGAAACSACYAALGRKPAAAGCGEDESQAWCDWTPHPEPGAPNYAPYATPLASLASCFNGDGTWDTTGCTFNQLAGELWTARSHQYLLANGIAVVQLNPYTDDTWEWGDPSIPNGSGLDQPYFKALFGSMAAGTYGTLGKGMLDISKLIVSGYSSGAQMSSWMMELQARNALPTGANIVAGVFYSGGSHMCYQSTPLALTQCSKCTDSNGYGPQLPDFTCSIDTYNSGTAPACDYCCPVNVTEVHYLSHPEDYHKHPPCFLAQSSKSDMNADLCAAKSYYDTLVVRSWPTSRLHFNDFVFYTFCVCVSLCLSMYGA